MVSNFCDSHSLFVFFCLSSPSHVLCCFLSFYPYTHTQGSSFMLTNLSKSIQIPAEWGSPSPTRKLLQFLCVFFFVLLSSLCLRFSVTVSIVIVIILISHTLSIIKRQCLHFYLISFLVSFHVFIFLFCFSCLFSVSVCFLFLLPFSLSKLRCGDLFPFFFFLLLSSILHAFYVVFLCSPPPSVFAVCFC